MIALIGVSSFGANVRGTHANDRRSRVATVAMLLAGAAIAPGAATAQVFDLGGAVVTVSNFDQTPGVPYAEVTNGELRVNLLADLTYAGSLNDSLGIFSLEKLGLGVLTLSGTNTYSGDTRVSGGILRAGAANSFSPNSLLRLNSNVDLNGFSQTVKGIVGSSTIVSSGAAATLTSNVDAGVIVMSGQINDGGSGLRFRKTGAGQQTLNGANIFSGGLEVAGGVVGYGTNTALGSGTIAFTGAGGGLRATGVGLTLGNAVVLNADGRFDGASSTLTGVISGPGRLIKGGNGTLQINNAANSYGATETFGGTLLLGNSNVLGTGDVTVSASARINALTTATLANNVILNSTLTVDRNGSTLQLDGVVSGAGVLNIDSGATLVLTNANTHTGSTQISGGTLAINNPLAINNGTGSVVVNESGTLRTDASFTITNTFRNGGVFTIDTNNFAVVLSGRVNNLNVAETGALIVTGGGTLSLTNVNNGYSAGTTVNDFTALVVSNDAQLGSGSAGIQLENGLINFATGFGATTRDIDVMAGSNGQLSVNGVGQVVDIGQITGGGTIFKNGAGTLILNEVNSFSGGFVVTGGTVQVDSSTGTGNSAIASAATLTGTGTLAATSLIEGSVSPGVGGVGTLSFNNLQFASTSILAFDLGLPAGVNDLINVSGDLRLDGTVNVNPLAGFGTGTYRLINYSGALTNNILTVGALPGGFTGAITLAPNQVNLSITGLGLNYIYWDGVNVAPNGVIDGGTGIWDTATNWTTSDGLDNGAWSGATAIFEGTAGTVTVVGSKLVSALEFNTAGYVLTQGAGGALTLSGVTTVTTATPAAGVTVLDVTVDGSGSLSKQGAGYLDLIRGNSYTGGTQIAQGIVRAYTSTSLGTGSVEMENGSGLDLVASGINLANDFNLNGINDIRVYTGTATISGVIDGPGTLRKGEPGFLRLESANSFGALDVQQGIVVAANIGALGGGTKTFADGTGVSFEASGSVTGNFVLNGAVSVGLVGPNVAFDDVVSGAGSLNLGGIGTLQLVNNNTYTGGTTLRGVTTLQIFSDAGLGSGMGALTFEEAGTTLEFVGNVDLFRPVVLNADAVIDTNGFNGSIFGGFISGGAANALTKTGAGQLTLTGSSPTFLGGTIVDQGTLRIEDGNSIGAGSLELRGGTTLRAGIAPSAAFAINAPVILAGDATIELTGSALEINYPGVALTNGTTLTINGIVSGAGALNVEGAGILGLNAANTYAGGTTVDSALIRVGNNAALGTGDVTFTGANVSGLHNDGSGLVTIANAIAFNNVDTTIGGSGDLTLSGTLTGNSTIYKVGPGKTIISGDATGVIANNLYAGGGILQFDGVYGDGSGRVETREDGTIAGSGTINADVIFSDGATLAPGSSPGMLTINGDLSLTGGTLLAFELGQAGVIGGLFNDQVSVSGNLVLDGLLNVTDSNLFGPGVYNLFTYGGALTDNTLSIASLPMGGAGIIQTLVAGQVNLIVTAPGTIVQYWDGTDFLGNGVLDGGTGTWNNLSTNWTGDPAFALNASWQGGIGVFAGTPGTVTISEDVSFQGLQFAVDGYVVNGGGGGILTPGLGFIQTGAGVNATINATIGGAGGIQKTGPGRLILNGTNTYNGGTSLDAGILTVGNDQALGFDALTMAGGTILEAGANGLALANNITTNGGARIDSGPGIFTLNGDIAGPGSISQIGSGNLVLNGNNSFRNLGINRGTVTVGTDTAAGIGFIAINDGAILAAGVSGLALANDIETTGGGRVNSGPGVFTLDGDIGGAGSISQIGSGNLVLNGDNSFRNLGINTGTVTVGSNTAAGIGFIAINDGAILAAGANGLALANDIETTGGGRVNSGPGIFTLNGDIAGAGSISQIGSGNLVLNGNNSFNNLGINTGTVTVGTNTAAGSGFIAINDGAILAAGVSGLALANDIETTGGGRVNSGPGVFTLNGDIGGAGSISQIGTGNLVLNGNNSFNNLGINTGTVTVGTNTAAGIGFIAINDGAILAAGANGLALANDIETTGGGRVNSGPGVFTLNGDIAGAGSISQIGSGNLVLNGNNSFINLGINTGTVTVGTNTAAGAGGIALNDGGILANGVDGLVLANNIETTGGGRIDAGPGAFTDFTLNGEISGAGSISQIGGGNLILNGNNSFVNLGINRGTVTLGNNTAAGVGQIAINDNATLAAGANGLVIENTVVTTGFGIVDSGPGVFTLNGLIGGPGSINQFGSGNLVLNGNNDFAGGLGVGSGIVTLGTNTAAGTGTIFISEPGILAAGANGLAIANDINTSNGARVDSGPGIFTLNGVIDGPGSISQIGSGNLVLNGLNSFAGGLDTGTGTVTLGTNSAAGTGILTITSGGIVAAGAPGLTIANAVETTGGGRVNSGPGVFTLSGSIGGLGSISQIGSGNLVLTGNSTYQGGLGVNTGTVTLGSNTAAGAGAIALNAATLIGLNGFTVANAVDTTGGGRIGVDSGTFTLSGSINNLGGIQKIGAGNLVLSGTSGFSGQTLVQAGRLTLTGALTASSVTVATGGSFGGTGSVPSLVVQAGGIVSPGLTDAAIGTLTVSGNASLAAGSTYVATIAGAQSDLLSIGGMASLGGAGLTLINGNAPGLFNATYTVLTATGGRTGVFTPTFSQFSQAFIPTLIYGPNSVQVRLAPQSIQFLLGSGGGGSSNIANIAAALDASVAAGFNPQPFFGIFNQSGSALGASLNQLTGEIHSANSRTAIADTRYIREAALDRLGASLGFSNGGRDGAASSENGTTFWARGIGSWTESDGDGNGSALDIDAKGIITGIDASFGEWKVGALFNYIKSDVDTTILGQGDVESTGGALYAGYRGAAGFAFGVGAGISSVDSKASRSITAPGIGQSLRSKTDGTSYQGFAEISFDLAASEGARVEPFARAAYVEYKVDSFSETGGFAALNVAKGKYDTTVLTAGLRGSVAVGGAAFVKASAGYQRTTGDRAPLNLVQLSGTSGIAAIRGVALDKSAFAGELGVDFGIGERVTIGAGYSGVIGKRTEDHGAKATLTIGF